MEKIKGVAIFIAVILCFMPVQAMTLGWKAEGLKFEFINFVLVVLLFLPVLPIYLGSRFPILQILLLVLLGFISISEIKGGFKPTNQLNHEGSDMFWPMTHTAFAILGAVVVGVRWAFSPSPECERQKRTIERNKRK